MESIMATSGTQKVFGGTRAQRYPDPKISNLPNQFGLYQWSVYKARLAKLNPAGGGAIIAENALASTNVLNLLLFASDVPAVTELSLTQADLAAGTRLSLYLPNSTTAAFTYTEPLGSSAVVVKYGEVAQGYVGTAKTIRCTGFPSTSTVTFGGTGAAEAADVILTANGATICSPVSANDPAGTSYSDDPALPVAPTPIILLNADYTQTIANDGNLIVDSAGKYWLVVGLYTIVVSG
jgi:hypothetical protein